MRWNRAAGLAAALALLPGCAVWLETRYPAAISFDVAARPAPGYYCYDCHGYRYFDPYYDWCAAHGFRYAWDRHPETVRIYRERYVRIKEQNPTYGRYRYRAGYRDARRYRQPPDYELWRSGAGSARRPGVGDVKVREKDREKPGSNKRKSTRQWRDRGRQPAEEPRDARPGGGLRPGTSGGA